MPIQFTCPHCGETTIVPRQHLNQTGTCRSCGRGITVRLDAPQVGAQPKYSDPNLVVKTTGYGGLVGCCIVVVVTLAFLVIPTIYPLMAAIDQTARSGGNDQVAAQFLRSQAFNLLVACFVGLASGIFLMGICAAILRNSPRLIVYAQFGALVGAVLPPFVIYVTRSIPLMLVRGVGDLKVHKQLHIQWRDSLLLGTVGAVSAMFIAVFIGVWVGRYQAQSHR